MVRKGIWWENLRKRYHLEDPRIDGKTVLKWSSRSGMGCTDWTDMAQNRNRWRALANAVMNFHVP